MRDGDVRAALRTLLDEEHDSDPDTLTIDELALCGQERVDVAVVNGYFAGFELKSARDTLRRLPTQVEVYSRVLDLATLVVAENHHERAVELLPDWWGVTVAHGSSAGVCLEMERPCQVNQNVEPHSLVRLLWHSEALDELEIRGRAAGLRSKPRGYAWARLAEEVPGDELRATVRSRLKARRGWRADR